MRTDVVRAWIARHTVEIIWYAFAAVCLGAMFRYPDWATVPFHLVWISFALLYGARAWSLGATVLALTVIVGITGGLITIEGLQAQVFPARTVEVPLMAAMFAAMMWHIRRSRVATAQASAVSQTNRALLRRERRFFQHASHELRTPITVALGHAELLSRSVHESQDAEDVEIMIDELLHMRRLTSTFLTAATSGDTETLQVSLIDIGSLFEATLRRWRAIDRSWSIGTIAVRTTCADLSRLNASIDALIDNAVKHTHSGDLIELAATHRGDLTAITVTDNGAGMNAEDLAQAFDWFTRGDTSVDRSTDGFGLGLALVKAVAEAHGGTADAQTTPTGSSISILLPTATAMIPTKGPADVI